MMLLRDLAQESSSCPDGPHWCRKYSMILLACSWLTSTSSSSKSPRSHSMITGVDFQSAAGQVTVLNPQRDSLTGPQRGKVHAGIERHQPLAASIRAAPVLPYVGNRCQQLASLARFIQLPGCMSATGPEPPQAHRRSGAGLRLYDIQLSVRHPAAGRRSPAPARRSRSDRWTRSARASRNA